MTTIDSTRLPDFLRTRRWFGGKGLPIKGVHVLEQVTLGKHGGRPNDGEGFTLAVLEVIYELGHPERYLAPLVEGSDGTPREATDDDDLARALLEVVRRQQEIPSGGGMLRGEILNPHPALKELTDIPTVRRISAEQSNTSIVFDDRVILKIIRKLDLGNNPEWEMGRFLQKHGYRNTPPLIGGIVLEGAVHSTVAVAHEFVPVEADGWGWMLENMRKGPASDAYLAELRKLGERLGELHSVLTSDAEDPLFSPEPILVEDLQRWSSSIIGELGVTMAAAMERVPELARRREELVEQIQRLSTVAPSGLKTRHHGDLHLGQTLRSRNDWLIFDFEGEPARAYAQRREKHSPLRDVAGMLRSFAYACATVELEGQKNTPKMATLRKAFLEGYRSKATAKGLLPEDETTFAVMLETLELEKLLYELRYEINHRPDWIDIPAKTLLARLS